MSIRLPSERMLMSVAMAWVTLLWLIRGLHPLVMAFAVTGLLIALNAIVSFRALTHKRKVLVALNCVQIVLFATLNYQLYAAFGPGHYRCDREPHFYDWIEFTLAHVARAADVLDGLDEWGLALQNITHQSVAAGILIVGMHLTVDIFLIGLVLRWAGRYWQDCPYETRLARGRREFGWLLATLTLYLAFMILQQMEPSDWLLWPLENILRLLDVGDLFQVFGWRLHGAPPSVWTSAAGLLFRLVAGLWMARFVMWVRMTLLRTWGVSIDELIELLDDADAQVRRRAALGLAASGKRAKGAAPALIAALHDIDPDVRTEAAHALGRIGPAARAAVDRLSDAVWLGHRELRLAALQALGRIGPHAEAAVESLVALLKIGDCETCRATLRALRKIAPGLDLAPALAARERNYRVQSPSEENDPDAHWRILTLRFIVFAPKVPQQISPGQSEAPPWVKRDRIAEP